MSALLHASGRAIVFDSPLIRAADARPVRDALDLLAEAEAVTARAADEAEAQRTASEAEVRGIALAEGRAAVEQALAGLAAEIADGLAERRADIAAAAFAAVRTLIGVFDEDELLGRLATGALARADGDRVVVTVAPARVDALAARLGDRADVRVVGDPAAGPFDCTLRTADGSIGAGLPLQLAALAERWGVEG